MEDLLYGILQDNTMCERGKTALKGCGSKKQVADIAYSIWALPWIAERLHKGIIDVEQMKDEYATLLNGGYVLQGHGYTSTYWIDREKVEIDTTAALVYGAERIYVPDNTVCELHIVNSHARIEGEGTCRLFLYGSEVETDKTLNITIG